jgi:hypothetical protein
MERETRRLDSRALLAVAALIVAMVAVWATGALAAGGSGSSPSSDAPAGLVDPSVQAGDGQAPSRDDCPENDSGSRGRGDRAPQGSGGSGESNDV